MMRSDKTQPEKTLTLKTIVQASSAYQARAAALPYYVPMLEQAWHAVSYDGFCERNVACHVRELRSTDGVFAMTVGHTLLGTDRAQQQLAARHRQALQPA